MEQNPKTIKKKPDLKIYPQIKLKQLSVVFILNYINNFIDPTKIYMTLLVPIKFFRAIIPDINHTC